MQAADQVRPAQADPREKEFKTLRARLAMARHALNRSDPADGPQIYIVSRWGMVRELRSLDDVRRFAEQVGAPAA